MCLSRSSLCSSLLYLRENKEGTLFSEETKTGGNWKGVGDCACDSHSTKDQNSYFFSALAQREASLNIKETLSITWIWQLSTKMWPNLKEQVYFSHRRSSEVLSCESEPPLTSAPSPAGLGWPLLTVSFCSLGDWPAKEFNASWTE